MDSRVLHIAFNRALRSVSWDRHGDCEYVLIGDGVETNEEKLQALINATFSVPVLWLSISRHKAMSIPRNKAAGEMSELLKSQQTITVSDENVHTFIEVLRMGIARTGVARSNYAFKRTGFARR